MTVEARRGEASEGNVFFSHGFSGSLPPWSIWDEVKYPGSMFCTRNLMKISTFNWVFVRYIDRYVTNLIHGFYREILQDIN